MKILITGTSKGIGRATAEKFIKNGFEVVGIDILPATIKNVLYTHYIADVSKPKQLPELTGIAIVINNAGTINEKLAIDVNYWGYVNIVDKYCYTSEVNCLINVASVSGHTGLDTQNYSSSQGARLSLTKYLAITLGKEYGMRVNSISPGMVESSLEEKLYADKEAMRLVADEGILKKWLYPEEVAEWIYFMAIIDKSMTGQDIIIDNGEMANYNFINVRD